MPSIKLGELLVKANVVNESQLKSALAEQQKWGGKLGEIMVRMSLMTEDTLVKALSKQMAIQSVNLDSIQGIPPHVRAKVPADQARELAALPIQLREEGKTLVVAMAEPQNLGHLDTLRAVSKCKILPNIAGRTAIARAFARFYEGDSDMSDFEGSFKVLDAQGRTVVKSVNELAAERPGPPLQAVPPVPAQPVVPRAAPRAASLSDIPASKPTPGGDPALVLRSVEEVQRKEVAALKAMVELMIEKGVFTREEYMAKVKR